MIPLRDELPTRRKPVVTYALIAMNLVVFVVQLMLGSEGDEHLVMRFGLIPSVITGGDLLVPNSAGGAGGALMTPITSMFLHGGFMHIAGNMWFLHIFGDNVEDAIGRFRYVAFYLLSGLCAAALQVAADPSGTMPMIGASGAISGVLAGYVMLHPKARIITLVPIIIFFTTMEIPAFIFIFVWFGLQLLNGLSSLAMVEHTGGVAWWAHIGGFAAGILSIKLFVPTHETRWERRPAPRQANYRDYL